MSREAIEVGAFTWSRIQRLYNPDATLHWQRCESEGLQCPQEVFTQLFSEKAHDEDFSVIVRSIDYYSALGLALRVAVGNAGVQRAKARVSRRFAPHSSLPLRAALRDSLRAFASAALSWGRAFRYGANRDSKYQFATRT